MGYFSEVLSEPAAQQTAAVDLRALKGVGLSQVLDGTPIGLDIRNKLFATKGLTGFGDIYGSPGSGTAGSWFTPTSYAVNESGDTGVGGLSDAALSAFKDYKFDWTQGDRRSGTLVGYDPEGKQIGSWYQAPEQSTLSSMLEALALAGAGFGLAGFAGLGPLGETLGGVFSAADAGAGAGVGADAGVAGGAAGAGTEVAGSGLSLGQAGTYGTITASPGALGAGGAGLGGGLTAPAFVAGAGEGIVGGLGMTAGAGAAASGSGGLGGLLSTIGGYLPAAQSLASIASGVYGMKLAGDARQASDPFAPYRGAYAQQLAALEKNPGSIVTRPGFQAGLETIGRKSAASGYYGSGNMASALSRYSGDFYNQEATRLAGLAGANATPGAGQALGADLASQSLASIGYGLGPLLQRLTKGG